MSSIHLNQKLQYTEVGFYHQRRVAIEAGDTVRASKLKCIINKEQAREMWRIIKNARQIVKGNSVREVTEKLEGSVLYYKLKMRWNVP